MKPPIAGPLTPSQLAAQCTILIARVCRCDAAWPMHPGPITRKEMAQIRVQMECLLEASQVGL